MAKEFPLVPIKVKPISTKYRKLHGAIPNKQTIENIEKLRKAEPISMRGQPPVIWHRSKGVNVFDAYGNMWLDFSSGVLITNAGHSAKRIVNAIVKQATKSLLTSYCFPNEPRIKLVQRLVSLAPKGLNKVFLLSTGSEGIECGLKLMRTYGRKVGGDKKNVVVSFNNGFHGRTLGSQQLGGSAALKAWIKNLDPEIVQVPFPDGFRCEDTSFELFEKSLAKLNIEPDSVAGVIGETYQGGGPYFMPKEYAQQLRAWCDKHGALLCLDEVQAAFGRCGKQWGFELYGIVPDLFCLGKGISSSLPISAVIGKEKVLDLYGPNEMTSTHSGNAVCCAAALGSIETIEKERLIQNAAKVGKVLQSQMQAIMQEFSDVIGFAPGAGLVGGLQTIKKGTKDPDGNLAWDVVNLSYRKGLMMFAPVGFGGGCIKIAPPLCITKEAVKEGCDVIRESLKEILKR